MNDSVACLVLIIIFMVIVAQSKEKGFKTEIPQPPANPEAAPAPVRTIVVQLIAAKGDELPNLKGEHLFRTRASHGRRHCSSFLRKSNSVT